MSNERRSSRRVLQALRRLALSEARKRPARVVVTVLMIALGSGALTTALVLGASVRTAVNDGLTVQYGAGIDVVDSSGLATAQDTVGTGESGQGISDRDVTKIAGLDDVKDVGTIYGTVAVAQVGDVARGLTLESLNSNDAHRWQAISEGRAPGAANEVALTRNTLDDLGIRLDDKVALGRPSTGSVLAQVVGVVDTRGSVAHQGSAYGIVTPEAARSLSGLTGPNEVTIEALPGADLPTLVNDINRVAPTGLPQTTDDILSANRTIALAQINAMDAVVTGLAAVSCLVAGITSATTTGASLSSRRRSWALLRCVGASRRQVAGLVAAESAILGLLGGVLGVVAGVAIARLSFPLVALVPGIPDLQASAFTLGAGSLLLPVLVALLLSAAGSVVPAVAAARIPPSAALKSTSSPARPARRTVTVGSLVLCLGGLGMALVQSDAHQGLLVVTGLLVGVVGFVSLLSTGLSWAARTSAARLGSVELRLGVLDVVRRPRAAVIETIAVILAVGMISLSWVALSSVQEATSARLSTTDSPDLVVGGVTGTAAIAVETVAALGAVDGVEAAVPVTFGQGISLVGRGTDGRVTLTTGTAAGLADDLGRALPKGFPVPAVRKDTVYLPRTEFPPFASGSTVTLIGPAGERRGVEVEYVEGLQLPSLVAPSLLAAVSDERPILEVWIALADGADRAAVVDELTGIAILGGELPVGGPTILDLRTAAVFSTARAAALAILAIAVLVAVIGAAATAALSIAERAREHATLRSLGLERSRLGRMLAARVVFVSTVGAVLGVGVGGAIGLVAARVVTVGLGLDPRTSLPVVPVLLVVIGTVLAVRVAALLPIEKASYVPPSRALAQA